MATRTISTKLAVEGESQYKASLTRINGEIKTLNSALKLAESQFQNNANSMAALTAKGDALKKLQEAQTKKIEELTAALANAQNAEAAYGAKKTELKAKIEANNKALENQDAKLIASGESWAAQAEIVDKCEAKLEQLRKTSGDTDAAQAKLEKRITAAKEKMAELETETGETVVTTGKLIYENKQLNAELKTNEQYLAAAGKGVTNWEGQLNTAKIKLSDTNAAIKLNGEYQEEARRSTDGCATSIDRFGDRAQSSAEKADALSDALMAAGVVAALKATADALEACADSSIDFESAMAGVSKTTNMTDTELAAMGDAIQDLAAKIPATATEIANVAEAAGRLGIAKEDILAFSEVMVNLGTSTNLSSTEAATALAKFANVVSMSADDYERLGSTIVALGNNFATTEADIVSMATRLASAGSLVGLTESEIMAVATALSSVGIEAEAGGSAVSKLLKQFETMVQTGSPKLTEFASVAGMSAEEFAAAWGENAVGALSKFIDGLGAIEAAGGSSVVVLEELGLKETRLSNAVQSMATSNGLLTKALDTANAAWEESTALANEAATRYETTESKLQLLANAADNAKIAVGDKLTPAIGDLAETGADALNWCADFIDQNDAIVPLVTATATAIGVLAVGVTAYTAAVKLAGAATKMFSSMMNANPIMLVATAIASVVAGLVVLENTIQDDTLPSFRDLTSAASDMNKTMDDATATRERTVESTVAAASVAEDYILRLKELETTGLKTAEQENEHRGILIALCQLVPELSSYIDIENNLLKCSTDELLANTEAWKQNAIQQAYQEELTALYQKQADVALEVAMNTLKMGDAEDAAKTASTNHAAALERMNELMAEAQEKARAAAEETGYLADAENYLTEEYYELQAALGGYSDEMTRASEEAEIYKQAVETGNESLAAANEEIGLTEEAIKSLTGATEENTKVTGENAEAQGEMGDVTGETVSQLDELSQAYQEAYESARESIDRQIGLFDTFAAKVSEDTNTVDEMMSRWAEQTQNLASYTENLKKAAEYGIDEGLLLSLADGSVESAGYLAAIIGDFEELGIKTKGLNGEVDEFVEGFNASFAQTQIGKDQFATIVKELEINYQTAIDSMEQTANNADFSGMTEAVETELDTMGTLAQSAGDEVGQSLASSIESGKSAVGAASQSVAQSAIDNFRKSWSSGAMNSLGRELVGDIAGGVKAQQSQLTGAIGSLGDGVSTALTSSMKAAVDSGMAEFSKVTARTRTVMNDIKSTISNAASGISLYHVGAGLIDGMISGISSRENALYAKIDKVNMNVLRRTESTMDVRSPSRKTTRIFEFVGDGMVLGLENRRQKISDTAQSVVSDALKLDISGTARATAAAIDGAIPNLDIDHLPVRNSASTIQHNYGGFEFHIHQRPGENDDTFAYRVLDVIQTELMRKEASIGG